jgi:hypothetical protein
MNRQEREMMIRLHKSELIRLESVNPSCYTCKSFDDSTSHCLLPQPSLPVPINIQPQGCPSWNYDGIPF